LYSLPHLYPSLRHKSEGRIKEGEGGNIFILPSPLLISPLPKGKGGDLRCISSPSLWEGEDMGGGGGGDNNNQTGTDWLAIAF